MTNLKLISDLTATDKASLWDNTFLKRSEGFKTAGKNACLEREVAFYNFLDSVATNPDGQYAICVRVEDVPHAVKYFNDKDLDIPVAFVAGFPDGAFYSTELKVDEARRGFRGGASEVDMVLNYKAIQQDDYGTALDDVRRVVDVTRKYGGFIKLIIETSELNPIEIEIACHLAIDAEVDMVKTSTGFGRYGATPKAGRLIKEHFRGPIKYSGNVTEKNIDDLLYAIRDSQGRIPLDPMQLRVGASKPYF
jgi:deoxyribose-phosphate aldolase